MNPYHTNLENIIVPLTALTTIVQNASSSWEESTFVQNNFLPLSGGIVTGKLVLTDVISGNNITTSFNQGTATGNYSFAEGAGKAFGNYSHAEGYYTETNGSSSHAEGEGSKTYGIGCHAEGGTTSAIGNYSHAEGFETVANGIRSHAAGARATAAHDNSWIWKGSTTSPNLSTTRTGQFMISAPGGSALFGNVGIGTDSTANALTIVGNISANNLRTAFNAGSAGGDYSFAEGYLTAALGYGSHAEGRQTLAQEYGSHAEGYATSALGSNSHAEGGYTEAQGSNSHAEGAITKATGDDSHAEGYLTRAIGNRSHAEGNQCVTTGYASHAQGTVTRAEGQTAFSSGYQSRAVGFASQACGFNGVAAHDQTFVWADSNGGIMSSTPNISSTRSNQFLISATSGVFIPGKVGIGTDSIANALTIAGDVSAAGSGYFNGGAIFGNATITGNASISSVTLGDNTHPNGVILFSNSSYGEELGFIGDDDTVLATRRSNGGAKIYEYGGGNPGSANLILSANNTEARFDINSLLVVLPNLPTSSAGLPTGALWNDTGTVKIVL